MPEVIKRGPTMFTAECRNCLTKFRYTISEVIREYRPIQREGVSCPNCQEFHVHRAGA